MFKSLLSLLKAIFVTAHRTTKVIDDITTSGLYYSESFLKEAYKENEEKTKELNINEEAFQASLEKIRKID